MNQQKAKTSYKYDIIFSLTWLQIQRNRNIFEIIKLLAINTCIRFGKPIVYISLYHTC